MPSPSLVTLFIAPLNRLDATYMVTGALAAGMYGDPRLTNDVDLVVRLSQSEADRLHAAFDGAEFYVPPLEVIHLERQRRLHGHFNLIHGESALRAVIYLVGEDPLHHRALGRREQVMFEGEPVWVAPPEYVILRKLQYRRDGGGDKHPQDIRAMLRTLGDRLDRNALHAAIREFGLEEEWARVSSSDYG